MSRVGLILLAAGGSTRMGTAKQLLTINKKTLISRATQTAIDSVCNLIVVAVGARSKEVESELAGCPVITVKNDDWETGMGSSIRRGMEGIIERQNGGHETEAVLIMLCDQPHVTPALLNQIVEMHTKQPNKIVACKYANTIGVPVLFPRIFYQELLAINPKTGAKKLIEQHIACVETIEFPDGIVDLDTAQDYQTFLRRKKAKVETGQTNKL